MSTFSQAQKRRDTTQTNFKNCVGAKLFGTLFLGNFSFLYIRNLVNKSNYNLNAEADLIYGYPLTRHTNNLGLGFSLNNLIGSYKHKLLIGIGSYFLCSPAVLKHPQKEIYSTTGLYEAKETIGAYVRIGWSYHFASHWGLRLAYNPGITFIDVWDYPKSPFVANYRFQSYFSYVNFEYSMFFYF